MNLQFNKSQNTDKKMSTRSIQYSTKLRVRKSTIVFNRAETLKIAAEVNNTEATLALVEAGVGYAFVSHWSVREIYRPKINILLELPTDRGFYLYVHSSRQSHPLIQMFAEEALRHYK
jgi:DNA-binding transcriptional LysR family regulator